MWLSSLIITTDWCQTCLVWETLKALLKCKVNFSSLSLPKHCGMLRARWQNTHPAWALQIWVLLVLPTLVASSSYSWQRRQDHYSCVLQCWPFPQHDGSIDGSVNQHSFLCVLLMCTPQHCSCTPWKVKGMSCIVCLGLLVSLLEEVVSAKAANATHYCCPADKNSIISQYSGNFNSRFNQGPM